MEVVRRPQHGFTLIELMVTIAVAALLGLVALPNLANMIDASRTSVLVNKFQQDVAWARNQAVTAHIPVQIVLGPGNCQWTTQTGSYSGGSTSWTTSTEHSMTVAQASSSSGATCQFSTGTATTLTLSFNSQGFVSSAPSVTVTAPKGQTWSLQVLASGSVLINSGSAS